MSLCDYACEKERNIGREVASIARSWHQDTATVRSSIRFGEEEHISRLVNGFSAIELRGIVYGGTTSSF